MLDEQSYRPLLEQGIAELKIKLSTEQVDSLLKFQILLAKWNKTHNLTAITDPRDMMILHILDSLTVVPFIKGKRVLDVGSGGGLPGIVLAIVFPEIEFESVDAREKKIQFQTLAASQLGLSNFKATHSRIQEYKTEPFNQIISRAFSSLKNFREWTEHLIDDSSENGANDESGEWLAMKGKLLEDEIEEFGIQADKTHELKLPFAEVERHLMVYKSKAA